MSSTIKRLPASRAQCTVTFTDEQVKSAEDKSLQHLSGHLKLEGFRPGKVPPALAREKIDPQQLLEETIRTLLPGTFESLLKEHSIKPIAHPKVELQNRSPLTVQITFVEYPEVKLKKVDSIKIEKKEPKADQKEIEKMVQYVLEQHKKTAPVDRASKEGDEVVIDFKGSDKDGKPIEGAAAQGYRVRIGSKTLIPGFEEQLIGLKSKDQKSFTLTFPEKYQVESLRNTPVTFTINVSKIEEVTIPTLTDAFAKEQLRAASAEDFRSRVKESMVEQEEMIERQRREQLLLEEIRKATVVELAPELVEEEGRTIAEELSKQLEKEKLSFEEYLKQIEQKPEEFAKKLQSRAEKRLQLRFGIRKLIEEKDVQIADDEMGHIVRDFLAPLSVEERLKIAPGYVKGAENFEQLRWQKRVEKMIEEMLK